MFSLLLVVSAFLVTVRGTVLQDCQERSAEGAKTLTGMTNSMTYIYLSKASTANIKFQNYANKLVLKIKIDCQQGTIKATSKPKKTWIKLGEGNTRCVAGEDLLVVVSGKKIFINSELIALSIPGVASLKGEHTVSVNGQNTVEKIAMGKCLEYPTSVSTCPEANQFYMTHVGVHGGALQKDGFLFGDYPPVCVGDDFGAYQITQSFDLMCSTKEGAYIEDTREAMQHIADHNAFIDNCQAVVNNMITGN